MSLLRRLGGLGFAARQPIERAVRAPSGLRSGLRAQYVLDRFLAEARGAGATGRFLDVGCGNRGHTEYVRQAGVFDSIACIDFGEKHRAPCHVRVDYTAQTFDAPFDAIWTSHQRLRNGAPSIPSGV